MPRSLAVLLLSAFLLVGGCSGGETPPVSGGAGTGGSSAPVSAPMSADPSATEDVPGEVVCGALAAAINDGTLMNPGMVDAVVAASSAADAPIADAAQRLATAYAAAVAAQGAENEPDAVAAVSMAGAEMSTICGESGLDTVG